jgi:hypothetical protein
MGIMGLIGFIISLVAAGFMLVGLIPFLGWINWFTSLPLAAAGAALSGISLTRRGLSNIFGILGLVVSIVVFFVSFSRLMAGCGIF